MEYGKRNRGSKSYIGQIHGYKIVTIKSIQERKQSLQIKFVLSKYILLLEILLANCALSYELNMKKN